MTSGLDLAHAAEGLVGTRFRLHGRHREHGLDCLGVITAALREIGLPGDFPTDYAWRNSNPKRAMELAGRWNFVAVQGAFRPGDVVLLRMGAAALHFAIAVTDGAFVHAHAGQRQVLLSPAMPAGRIVEHWRLDPKL
jgi:cell wall-associated NlpC family hydrolase